MLDFCLTHRLMLPVLGCAIIFANQTYGQDSGEALSRLKPDPPTTVTSFELEASIDRGVQYLIDSQLKNGCWGGPQWTGGVDNDPVPGAFRSFDIAVTAMCLEALLDTGESPQIKQARRRAEAFLFARNENIKRAGPYDLPHVWAHCYCIQTFAKMHQRSKDKEQKSKLSRAIREHMDGLRRWQSIHGGWFYYGSGMSQPINPSCSFVNGAILIALARAKQIGIDCDQAMLQKAIEATQRMRKPDSSFVYSMRTSLDNRMAMRPINRPAGSLGRSQVGNIALRLWDDKEITNDVITVWLDRLVTRHGWLDMGRKRPIPHESHAAVAGYFYYFGMYYGSVCMEVLPDDERPFYQHHLSRLIIDRQEKDGSWFDYPLYRYHKPYGTAFALLSLQRCRVETNETGC